MRLVTTACAIAAVICVAIGGAVLAQQSPFLSEPTAAPALAQSAPAALEEATVGMSTGRSAVKPASTPVSAAAPAPAAAVPAAPIVLAQAAPAPKGGAAPAAAQPAPAAAPPRAKSGTGGS